MEASNAVALERVTLEQLKPGLANILIVGIIIAKQKPRKFIDNKSPQGSFARAVWNFTLRDSIRDYINVTYWGSPEVIFKKNELFHTGDIIEIINPIIDVRSLNDYGEQFRPMVTSPYTLTLNDRSSLLRHDANSGRFLQLLRVPTKPLVSFILLRDIHSNGSAITDFVTILVVLKGLRPVREVTSKSTNEAYKTQTIEVFDHTSPSLKVEIWDNDIIQRAARWTPRTTVLFMTDVKIVWSNFERQYIAKITSRTVITENPVGKEADMLANFAKSAPIETFDVVDQLVNALPNPSTIQNVMTVKQIQDNINAGYAEKQFTALLYVFISHFDLDGSSKTILIKCGKCKMEIKGSRCENAECPTVYQNEEDEPEFNFDIRINLTDHTGTLTNCRLSGLVAEQVLQCTPREFSNMSDEEKEVLKWKYLFERFAVCIGILFVGNQSPIISVLGVKSENPLEVCRRLAVY